MKRSTWLPIQRVRHMQNQGCQLGEISWMLALLRLLICGIGRLSRQVFSRQIDKCTESGNPSEFVFQCRSRISRRVSAFLNSSTEITFLSGTLLKKIDLFLKCVSIGPLSSSSCSEGDTFRCVSWCSSFKISWSSSVVSSSSCPIMSSSMSSSFTSNSRSLAVVKISSIISGMYP
ncbi:UNVERIFIED_CONTAM: hypothetical protein NCL1_14479 [Trichonephila clavipes]